MGRFSPWVGRTWATGMVNRPAALSDYVDFFPVFPL